MEIQGKHIVGVIVILLVLCVLTAGCGAVVLNALQNGTTASLNANPRVVVVTQAPVAQTTSVSGLQATVAPTVQSTAAPIVQATVEPAAAYPAPTEEPTPQPTVVPNTEPGPFYTEAEISALIASLPTNVGTGEHADNGSNEACQYWIDPAGYVASDTGPNTSGTFNEGKYNWTIESIRQLAAQETGGWLLIDAVAVDIVDNAGQKTEYLPKDGADGASVLISASSISSISLDNGAWLFVRNKEDAFLVFDLRQQAAIYCRSMTNTIYYMP